MAQSITPTATFASLVGQAIGYLDSIVWILGSVALIFFLWGVLQYIYHQGKKPKRNTMLWSLLALFVLFSIWGILNFMCSSLGTVCTGRSTGTIGGTSNGSANGTGLY